MLLVGSALAVEEKFFGTHQYHTDEVIKFFLNNPVTKSERECFAKFQPGDSIDFVIDLAPSPSLDKVDKMCADSPIGLYLESGLPRRHSATRSYFDFLTTFIDVVTYDMKPEMTHCVLLENGRKFFIRGRAINETVEFGGEFEDKARNLKTIWPVSTKSFPETHMAKILVNNLGRMTKLALWNRNNGLPTVLSSTRKSKAFYTVVITDGASGAKIEDLTDDLTRTTVIDIGNHRFVKSLSWDQVRQMPSVLTLTAPQNLMSFSNTVRTMACWLGSNRS